MAHDDGQNNRLGAFLKDRRARLDPSVLGVALERRRTPGLRREEVAQRAFVSATWYTWLEQGRGGAPSAQVLDRIARALMLTDAEREHLFLLGLGRSPERHLPVQEGVTPRMQRLLDALEYSPAYLKTYAWDVVAWNRAATAVLHDYSALDPKDRNVLRFLFTHVEAAKRRVDWEKDARFLVAAFRADITRAGAMQAAVPFIEELSRLSPEFAAIWQENDVRDSYTELAKSMIHPVVGELRLEYSTFSVDGRPDLGLVVFNPVTAEDKEKVQRLMDEGEA